MVTYSDYTHLLNTKENPSGNSRSIPKWAFLGIVILLVAIVFAALHFSREAEPQATIDLGDLKQLITQHPHP